MADNEIGAQMSMEIGKVLAAMDQLGTKLGQTTTKMSEMGAKADSFGTRAGAAAGAMATGMQKALEIIEAVLHAMQDIDNKMIDINKKGGQQNLDLASSLGRIGVKDIGKTARTIRSTYGIADQKDIDTFVGGIGDNVGDKLAGQLAGAYAQGGKLLFGEGASIHGLTDAFSDYSGSDIGDLAVEYNQAASGALDDQGVGILNQLVGNGVDRNTALAIMAKFQQRNQTKGLREVSSAVASGISVDDILGGRSGNDTINKALAGVGQEELNGIGALAQRFRSVTSRDVIGDRLGEISRQSPALAAEIALRRNARNAEVIANQAADGGVGLDERIREQALDQQEFQYLTSDDPSLKAAYWANKKVRDKVGDRAAELSYGNSQAKEIGREVGRAMQTKKDGG